jgi:hypothetical protein
VTWRPSAPIWATDTSVIVNSSVSAAGARSVRNRPCSTPRTTISDSSSTCGASALTNSTGCSSAMRRWYALSARLADDRADPARAMNACT